jgi:hypothetical protein
VTSPPVAVKLWDRDCELFYISPADLDASSFSAWLRGRSSWNMAYQLSAHYAAMRLNMHAGFVSADCTVRWNGARIQISTLMEMAEAALFSDGCTLVNSSERALQESLKDALDRANNNIWN